MATQPNSKKVERRSASDLCAEMVGFLLKHPGFQKRAVLAVDVGVFPEGPDRQLMQDILDHCQSSGPIEGSEFINQLDDPDEIALATQRLTEEKYRSEGEQWFERSDTERGEIHSG